MRIVIEIDGDAAQVSTMGAGSQGTAATPPFELALAAAALGAESAGPAPTDPGATLPLAGLPPTMLDALDAGTAIEAESGPLAEDA